MQQVNKTYPSIKDLFFQEFTYCECKRKHNTSKHSNSNLVNFKRENTEALQVKLQGNNTSKEELAQ